MGRDPTASIQHLLAPARLSFQASYSPTTDGHVSHSILTNSTDVVLIPNAHSEKTLQDQLPLTHASESSILLTPPPAF